MKKVLNILFFLLLGFALSEYLHKKEISWSLPFFQKEQKYYEEPQEKENKAPSSPFPQGPNFISQAANKAIRAVVNIDTVFYTRFKSPFSDFFGEDPFEEFFGFEPVPQKGMGSGFIVKTGSQGSYVLTNEHVIEDANKITVTLSDKRRRTARVIGKDKKLDLAVLKIPGNHLPTLRLGDSDKLQLGDWVVAVGNPFGIGHTVTAGIVSAKHRRLEHPETKEILENLIQTDAAINRGNSGGPLVNLQGEVVGVNTAIYSPSGGNVGIGFAIAINDIKAVLDQLVEKGRISWPARPWIGIEIGDLENLPEECPHPHFREGVFIGRVFRNTPAAKAGLLPCDVVLQIDKEQVTSPERLQELVRRRKVGDEVVMKIWRDGVSLQKRIRLGKFPERTQNQ